MPGEEDHRVDGRRDHFLLDRLIELDVRNEPPQHGLEIAASLARDEARREHLRVQGTLLPEGLGKRGSGLDPIPHRPERPLEEGVPLAFDHEVHRLREWKSRLEQRREFLSEELQILGLDPWRAEPKPLCCPSVRKEKQALTLHVGFQRPLIRGIETPFDDLPGGGADLADVLHKLLEQLSVAAEPRAPTRAGTP